MVLEAEADPKPSPCSLPDLRGEKDRARAAASASWSKSATDTVERLRGELSATRHSLHQSEVESRATEADRLRLIDQVVTLEADRRALLRDAERWRRKCLELEQENSNLALREDIAEGQLREAQLRERELALRNIKRSLATVEAENQQIRAQAEARGHAVELERLERAVVSKSEEVDALRAELRDTRAQAEAYRVAWERADAERDAYRRERDSHEEARREAEGRVFALQARADRFEASLKAATAKQLELTAEIDTHRNRCIKLEEANRRLRLDLQEAISQAVRCGEVPFYAGSSTRPGVPACVEDLGPWPPRSPPPPQYSLKSRLEYPRSARARQLRSDVLSARAEALDRIEQLG